MAELPHAAFFAASCWSVPQSLTNSALIQGRRSQAGPTSPSEEEDVKSPHKSVLSELAPCDFMFTY
jgi:hypothetical protein